MNAEEMRRQWAALLARDETEIELDRAALLIAAAEYPQLDIEARLAQIDALAEGARERFSPAAGPRERLRLLCDYLFVELGFRGNRGQYFDARNSFLNDVLDRRLGIPITLSVLLIEVGRRLGVKVEGVGMPGHFLVRHDEGEGEVFFDPFDGGREVTDVDCRAMLVEMHGEGLIFHPSFLRATPKRQILTRMLQNLKGIYARAGNYHKLLATIERVLTITPEAPAELRDRGLALGGLQRYHEAQADLEAYLRARPDAEDAKRIRERLGEWRRRQAGWN